MLMKSMRYQNVTVHVMVRSQEAVGFSSAAGSQVVVVFDGVRFSADGA